jgi:hypothetical integral membrane protein (TIGR02206 family)
MMSYVLRFFSHDIDHDKAVQLFTWSHAMLVFFAFLTIFLTLKYSQAIYESANEEKVRNIAFAILIILEIIYHVHNWSGRIFSIPLHICSFAVVMNLTLLKTNSQKIFEYVFFFGVLGGFIALLIPISYGYPYYNIRYYHFIILHCIIIAIPLYYYKAYGFRVTFRTTHKTFLMVLFTMPIIFQVNRVFKTNYWFINEIPDNVTFIFKNQFIYYTILISVIYLSQLFLFYVSNRNSKVKP